MSQNSPQQTAKSQLTATVVQKLEQKVQQLNQLLKPEGRALLQQAKDDFVNGVIDVRLLTEQIKQIKERFTLITSPPTTPSSLIANVANTQQPSILSSQIPSQMILQTNPSSIPQNNLLNTTTQQIIPSSSIPQFPYFSCS